jgi:hypothetical protein
MTSELQHALARHTQWFGSYKKSGELKKIQVWLTVRQGQIEFLTPGDSYKVKRVRRNPHVICYVGGKDGPAIPGTAEIITARDDIMLGLRVWIEILLNSRVVVRVQPDDPNPLAGLNDPAA